MLFEAMTSPSMFETIAKLTLEQVCITYILPMLQTRVLDIINSSITSVGMHLRRGK